MKLRPASQAVSEWDPESYARKYKGTISIFDHTGEPIGRYVHDLEWEGEDDHPTFLTLNPITGGTERIRHHPKYARVASGYYFHRLNGKPQGWLWLGRRPVKTYHLGICPSSHVISTYRGNATGNWAYLDIDFVRKTPIDTGLALEKDGPISELMYLDQNEVFFGLNRIGVRHNKSFFVLDEYKQELMDALKGHGCSISV